MDLQVCRHRRWRQPEQAADGPLDEIGVVGCVSGELDCDRFECADEGERGVPGWWAGWDRSARAASGDQIGAVGEHLVDDLRYRAADRMVLPGELDPQDHQDSGDVATAVDRVAARDRHQRLDRVASTGQQVADLGMPGLLDPPYDRQRQFLLVGELVVQGAAGVAGLVGHALQGQVGVPVRGQPPRRRLQQGASAPGAPLRLATAGPPLRLRDSHLPHIQTYTYVSRVKNVSSAVGPRNVPEAIQSLSTMENPDYVDLFTLTTPGAHERSAEQWARAMFEDIAGIKAQLIWRVLLGLRLSWRRTPDHVAGWLIAERGDDWLRLEAASWFMTGHLVVQAGGDQVSLVTFIRYDRRMAARIWTPLSAKHRQLAPGLLRQALERLRELERA